MTDQDIPFNAVCDVCKQPTGTGMVYKVQAVEDEEGNPIVNAPVVYLHKECLNRQGDSRFGGH